MLDDPKTTVKSAHDVARELKNRVLDREDVLGHIEPKE